jgi:hypothetical protein
MSFEMAIEDAVAAWTNDIAWSLGSVLFPYVLIAFVYGRVIRKYTLKTIFLGLPIALGIHIIAQSTMGRDFQYLFVVAIVGSFVGVELADSMLAALKRRRSAEV